MRITKLVCLAALAMLAGSPALAKHHHRHPVPPGPAAASPEAIARAEARGGYDTYTWGPDPQGVYVLGQKVGRDPDPNIRQQLYNDYWYLYWH